MRRFAAVFWVIAVTVVFVFGNQFAAAAFSGTDLMEVNEKSAFFSESADDCAGSTTCACPSGSILLNGSNNAEQIWNFFTGQGMQAPQVAGLMGNLMAESGLNPHRVQNTKTPAGDKPEVTIDGKTGYGLAQWTSAGRQQRLAGFAQEKGVSSGDLGLQLQFIMKELRESYKATSLDPLLAAGTVDQATDVILGDYERPADISGQRPIRLNFARGFLSLYGSGTGINTAPAESTNNCAAGLDSKNCPTGPISTDQTTLAGGIRVHDCIAQEVTRIVGLAKSQGIDLSGWGWRDTARQIELRNAHGCGGSRINDPKCKGSPPTAVPGRSRHERGTAVDFTCGGSTISSHSSKCFVFLRENTSLVNLPSEPWHWSVDGG